MSRQADLFDRATDCQRRFDHASSPEEKGTFKVLRDLWTALANESVVLSPDHLAKEIAAIEELQSKVLGPDNIGSPQT